MKKSTKILLALVLLFGSMLTYQLVQKARVTYGTKTVSIEVIDERTQTTVLEKTEFKTKADYLGTLMDELSENGKVIFTMTGKKTDVYGRMLVGVGEVKHDPKSNQYWSITSPNNKECVKAGYCTGVDLLPIHNGDEFILIIK